MCNFRIPFTLICSSRFGLWIDIKKLGSPLKIVACVEFLRGPQNAWPAGHAEACVARAARHATCVARPALRATKDGRVPNNSRCMVARCLPREVANNARKVAQFNRPIFQSNLFKSSRNAVVSLTGATASRLRSSCQSKHSLLAFVQRKTEKYGGKIFWAPLISPNFEYRVPNFFLQLERNGLHISAKFRERIPNRWGPREPIKFFKFFGRRSFLTKDMEKLDIVS